MALPQPERALLNPFFRPRFGQYPERSLLAPHTYTPEPVLPRSLPQWSPWEHYWMAEHKPVPQTPRLDEIRIEFFRADGYAMNDDDYRAGRRRDMVACTVRFRRSTGGSVFLKGVALRRPDEPVDFQLAYQVAFEHAIHELPRHERALPIIRREAK